MAPKSYHARRNALARSRGFRNYYEERKAKAALPPTAPKGNTRRAANERTRLAQMRSGIDPKEPRRSRTGAGAAARQRGYRSSTAQRAIRRAVRRATGITSTSRSAMRRIDEIGRRVQASGNADIPAQAEAEATALTLGFDSAQDQARIMDIIRDQADPGSPEGAILDLARLAKRNAQGQRIHTRRAQDLTGLLGITSPGPMIPADWRQTTEYGFGPEDEADFDTPFGGETATPGAPINRDLPASF